MIGLTMSCAFVGPITAAGVLGPSDWPDLGHVLVRDGEAPSQQLGEGGAHGCLLGDAGLTKPKVLLKGVFHVVSVRPHLCQEPSPPWAGLLLCVRTGSLCSLKLLFTQQIFNEFLRYIRHREGGPGGTPTATSRKERVQAAKGAEGGVVREGGGGGRPGSREVREFPKGAVADRGAAEKCSENRK